MDPSAKLFATPRGKLAGRRRVVKANIGCYIPGVSRPQCDPDDPATLADGAVKRFLNKPISDVDGKLEPLREFVEQWCIKNLKQLGADTDVSFDTWIEKAPYPRWRKRELTRSWNAANRRYSSAHRIVSSFIKNEGYDTWKHARWINSRSDEFKCFAGPWISALSKPIFELPEFIKTVPVAERPEFIIQRIYREGCKYICSDYTAFEAHFTPYIMRTIEFIVYRYILANVPGGKKFLDIFESVVCGVNRCKNKNLRMRVLGKRMSGEFTTSVGNGIANLLLLSFLAFRHDFDFIGVFEGDDALAVITRGDPPTSDMYRDLGFDVKLDVYDDLCQASFCGLVFDIADRAIITDPRRPLAEAHVGDPRYLCVKPHKRNQLLRSKGYSYVHGYPGCPIIQSLGLAILRCTEGVDMKDFLESRFHYRGTWIHEKLVAILEKDLPVRPIGESTRLLMESKFNVSCETQRNVEQYFDKLQTLEDIQVLSGLPVPHDFFPNEWHYYDEVYSVREAKTQNPSDAFLPFKYRRFDADLWHQRYLKD